MPAIHATAEVDPGAILADDVVVGPYSVVGKGARLAAGVVLESHVVIDGSTELGEGTRVHPFAAIGLPPQHRRDAGSTGRTVLGRNCVVREHVTVHRGMDAKSALTAIGDDCYLMVGVHVAHDCKIGNRVTMANNATLGGHVIVGDDVNFGGISAIHQNVAVGRLSMVPAFCTLRGHVVPYAMVYPAPTVMGGTVRGANIVGLRRNGFSRDSIRNVQAALRLLFGGERSMSAGLDEASARFDDEAVRTIVDFVRRRETRGFLPGDFRDDR